MRISIPNRCAESWDVMNPCGRLSESLLNRPLRASSTNWKRSLAAVVIPVMMMLGAGETVAQNAESDVTGSQTEQTSIADPVTISGVITDEETGEPLMFTTVYLKNTKFGVSTDRDGNFSFVVSRKVLQENPVLVTVALGYGQQEITLEPAAEIVLNLNWERHEAVKGEYTIEVREPEVEERFPREKEELKEQRKKRKSKK